ncbi:NUDIX hydrolase [Phenylobacterium sp.]|jgi:8-oxo-dGTP pyrophosphatase MutT (NUDIX family)|uniref:NUDIX hydrolase n=1 Tax=Phenylobacterium sp. TaxID=1871053 RepID=UPI002F952A7A
MSVEIQPWRVTSSTVLREDAWIRLREETCVTPAGAVVSPFYVLDYPDFVHIVPFAADHRVLLVEQYRHGLGVVTLEIPAGRFDPGESDPLVVAARELKEETGCEAAELRLLQVTSPNPSSHSNRIHTVLATGVRQVGAPHPEASEDIRSRWTPPESAFRAVLEGEIVTSMQAASLLVGLHAIGRLGLLPTIDGF